MPTDIPQSQGHGLQDLGNNEAQPAAYYPALPQANQPPPAGTGQMNSVQYGVGSANQNPSGSVAHPNNDVQNSHLRPGANNAVGQQQLGAYQGQSLPAGSGNQAPGAGQPGGQQLAHGMINAGQSQKFDISNFEASQTERQPAQPFQSLWQQPNTSNQYMNFQLYPQQQAYDPLQTLRNANGQLPGQIPGHIEGQAQGGGSFPPQGQAPVHPNPPVYQQPQQNWPNQQPQQSVQPLQNPGASGVGPDQTSNQQQVQLGQQINPNDQELFRQFLQFKQMQQAAPGQAAPSQVAAGQAATSQVAVGQTALGQAPPGHAPHQPAPQQNPFALPSEEVKEANNGSQNLIGQNQPGNPIVGINSGHPGPSNQPISDVNGNHPNGIQEPYQQQAYNQAYQASSDQYATFAKGQNPRQVQNGFDWQGQNFGQPPGQDQNYPAEINFDEQNPLPHAGMQVMAGRSQVNFMKHQLEEKKRQELREVESDTEAGRRSLPNKMIKTSITDFMTLEYDFDYEKAIGELKQQWNLSGRFHEEKVISLLIYIVKSRDLFERVISDLELDDDDEFKLSASSLFIYLLENADENFKAFLFNVCSQFMPIPLYTRRYFSNDPSSFHCWTQALHVYEKQVNAISFELPNLEGRVPKRCCEIVNAIFGKQFEPTPHTKIDTGGVFVQFDQNCSLPRYQAVFLKQGPTESSIIESAAWSEAFNIIVVHYIVESDDDLDNIEDAVKAFSRQDNKVKIYALVQTSRKAKWGLEENGRIQIRYFEEYNEMSQSKRTNLKKQCWKDLKSSFFEFSEKDYEVKFGIREQSKNFLLRFLDKVGWIDQRQSRNFSQEKETVMKFLNTIFSAEKPKGESMLPFNFYNYKMSRSKQKLREENQQVHQDDRAKNLQQKIIQCKGILSQGEPTVLIKSFVDLYRQSGMLLRNLVMITALLKGLYYKRITPLQANFKKLREEAEQGVMNPQDESIDLEKAQKKFKKQELEQMFSLELLFREVYFLSRQKKEFADIYTTMVARQIQSAQPIELIDGDNLLITDIQEAIQQLYNQKFVTDKDDITIVSIVGPQSSGKSLLLKFLFGTQFFSSEGRCTKGVYFSLLKMKMREGKFKYILLLDTEGIQSSEARDSTFDSRIIFFIMCVSNIILICNKQEMNAPMAGTLSLAIDNWINAKNEVVQNPKIFVVMNKLASLNDDFVRDADQSIQDTLNIDARMSSENKLAKPQTFGIPTFFNSTDFGPGTDQVRPVSKEFLSYIQKLRKAIVDECGSREGASIQSLDWWFKQAKKLWETTDDFNGLHQFMSLNEKRDDQILAQQITQILREHLIHKEGSQLFKELQQEIDDQIENEVKVQSRISKHLENLIFERFEQMQSLAFAAYQQYSQTLRFSKKLIEKRQRTIERHRIAEENNCRLEFNKKISVRLLALSQHIGNQEVQDQVIKIMHQNKKLSKDQADAAFSDIWKKALTKMIENNRVEKGYEKIASFIRDEFTRQDTELERHNLINEKTGHKVLCRNNQGIDALRIEFFRIISTQQPLFRLPDIKPSVEELLELNNLKTILVKVPKGLFSMSRVVYDYNKRKMVELAFDQLAYIKDYSHSRKQYIERSVFGIKTFEVRRQSKVPKKSLFGGGQADYLEIPFNALNNELMYLNLKFDTSNSMLKKFAIDEDGRDAFLRKFDKVLEEQLANPKNYELFHEQDPPFQLNSKQKYFLFNPKKQNLYLGLVATTRLEPVDLKKASKRAKNQLVCSINEDIAKRNKFSHDFVTFLQALMGNQNVNMIEDKMVQQAISFLEFEKAFSMIEEVVASQIINNQGNQENKTAKEQLEQLLSGMKLSEDIEEDISAQMALADTVVDSGQEVCSQILSGINSGVITLLNKEYSSINLGISQAGKSSLFTYASVLMARIWELKQLVGKRTPIMNFLKQKENEKNLTVARLTCNDGEIDSTLATHLIQSIKTDLETAGKQKAQDEFKITIQNKIQDFGKKDIVNQLDNQAITIAKIVQQRLNEELRDDEKEKVKEVVEFYLNPGEVLKKRARNDFNSRKNDTLRAIQKEFQEDLVASFQQLKSFLKNLSDKLITKGCAKAASEILRKKEGIHDDAMNARMALAKYFVSYAQQTWNQGQEISVKTKSNDQVKFIEAESVELPSAASQPLGPDLIASIKNAITNRHEISNLLNFCQSAIAKIDEQIEELLKNPIQLGDNQIMKDTLNQIINNYQGCTEVCPLCRRQCDQNHDEREAKDQRQHKCSNGHQLQGFGGNKHHHDDKAVTWPCEVLEDDDTVMHKRQKMKFKQFKMEYLQWSFQSQESQARDKERKKFVEIWNLVGPQLCEAYNTRENKNIIFDRAEIGQNPKKYFKNFQSIDNRHFVFVLDGSRSMSGQPWSDLMTSYNGFISALTKTQSRGTTISVIQFASSATVEFREADPSNLPSFDYRDGGTNFKNALSEAYGVCCSNLNRYEQIDVYFMSDGQDNLPEIGSWNTASFRDKLKFYSVAFGAGADINTLSTIAEQMGGTFTKALNLEELKSSMMQMLVVLNPYST